MAEVKSSVIGELSGRIENFIYRNRYGKVIAYHRPVNQKVSKSQKAVTARKNFASLVALAKTVNSVPKLKEVWRSAKVEGTSAYHRLIRNNARLVYNGLLTTENKITPEGLPIRLISAEIENKILYLSLECPVSPDLTFPAMMYIHLYFGNASGSIALLFKEISEPKPGGVYNLELSLEGSIKKLLSKDPAPVVYAALAGGTAYKKKVYWTSTVSSHL